MHIDHFAYGWLTPVLSYALSVLGSLVGLIATARARRMSDPARRARWLVLAAWSIGGTGIWVMHFMAMIGFAISGITVRYDIPITLGSWILAIVVVGIGLFIVGFGPVRPIKILAAGMLTGLGVAGMHYSGMAAMRGRAVIDYDPNLVAVSVGVAVVASTVALWFTVTIRRPNGLIGAALIMGVAVEGMHYTGMFAMRVVATTGRGTTGILPILMLAPIVIFVVLTIAALLTSLLSRADDEDGRDPAIRPT